MCVWHIQSICKTVTGTAFLVLVSRNNESLKKFILLSFPLWLCCEMQEQVAWSSGKSKSRWGLKLMF